MKTITVLPAVMPVLLSDAVCAQEVPKGVRYKPAGEQVNALAKSSLEQAIASPEKFPEELFGEVLVFRH